MFNRQIARIVIYSDQPVLAKGLESVIAADPALHLDASFTALSPLRAHLSHTAPDVAVLDLTPEMTLAALNGLQSAAPDCKLILWAHQIAPEYALRALTIGVRGVLSKTLPAEMHRQCLHRVHAGDLWYEKRLTDSFRSARRVVLTQRESQLVSLLAQGMKNKEISSTLGITEGTVKVYLSHLFQKSGVKDRFELALHGLKNQGTPGVFVGQQGGLQSLVMEPVCHQ